MVIALLLERDYYYNLNNFINQFVNKEIKRSANLQQIDSRLFPVLFFI